MIFCSKLQSTLHSLGHQQSQVTYISFHCTTPAPPTPTDVTAQLLTVSSVKVTWQWNSSDPASNCFSTTTVNYHPEGGGESFLQLRDLAANETILNDLQCNTHYTITVVATAGEHRREGVTSLSLQGIYYWIPEGIYCGCMAHDMLVY